ncbi:MarR family transcriptional regulator [Clostridium sp. CX1]|uniref:MarR family transcriptional regulator n=1 Tax=Clostridium tanneri TaxID=3037988 RepID=A0ABU4JTI9_9CLOT|nr:MULTISPECIES: MarR family transcriptional regulator [unclassified Clostridium]MCT8978132.1 MarR family transcriptional regulator [Clostridium sp. CX1]MDW8801254.1 MarR family transcriptional regulator [Clostridium sp. A1-XYC3]
MKNESFGKYIGAINRRSQSLINKKLEGIEIGSGQYEFFYLISQNQGISQKELSERLEIGKATTAKAVKVLMKNGYVRREKDLEDKRFYKLYLTEEGTKIAHLVTPALEEIMAIYSSGFTDEESVYVLKVLKKILNNVYNATKDMDLD